MRPRASEALAPRTIEVTYPGAVKHVSAVRADLRPLLRDCPLAYEIILCASELAANAALHSNSRLPGGTFTVRVEISPGHYVRMEVEDDGGPWTAKITDSTGHHGWDLVRALATDWGIEDDRTTRTTWARFDWPEHP